MKETIEARFHLQHGGFRLDAEFSLPALGITALFGPSGAGKSTILRCMAGLERAPGGYFRVGDAVWQDEAQDLFVPTHERSLGYVFQEVALFPFLSVEQNLRYGFRRIPELERRIQVEEAVDWLGVTPFLNRRPASLSGGERQRVAIARALLTSPRLLLMDEPLAALDLRSKSEILPYLEQLPQRFGIPIIYVSHSLEEVAHLADHMLYLDRGQVKANGPLAEILTRLDLPLAHQDTATAILEATLAAHDDVFALTRLSFAGGEILLPRRDLAIGRKIRVAIHARDVSLSLSRAADSSILNVIPATVMERAPEGPSLEVIRLEAGGSVLLSRITRKSADALKLQAGTKVFAQVKSVALLE